MKIKRYTYHKIKRNLVTIRHIATSFLITEIIIFTGICLAYAIMQLGV